ncbi:MAG: hypothetical protein VKL39_02860 [Leptolyngbyaceae bacterium]|nr:hypothetical protein [Leptolyngbyaceae bacterium]
MAVIQIYRYEILQDSGLHSFTAGDIIDVFVETDEVVTPAFIQTAGITVELNGSPLTISPSYYLTFDPQYVLTQDFGVEFCSGTYLIDFGQYTIWPFAQYAALADHFSCVMDSPTCDLILNGTPTVVPATDETTADGSVTINATSTNPIQYKIGEDFVYGGGQSSPTFSGLLPGTYRIFMRDSKNCALNTLVVVPSNNTFGTIYRVEYDDIAGVTTRLDIQKRGYSGSITEISGGVDPFQLSLRGEGETDKFKPILSSEGNLTIISEQEDQFIELYTNDRNLYRIEYRKGGVAKWTGKVLPFIYQEVLKAPPFETQIIATDGLPELRDLYFIQEDGQVFTGTMSLIKLVAYILKKLKLDLHICVGVNMYAEGMDTTAADDPFDQAYCDLETFYLAEDQPSLDFVLKTILEPFNARLLQWENKWWIVKIEELATTFDYREFDEDGDYVSNSSYTAPKNVDYPDANGLMYSAFPNRELRPGYGQVKVNYRLGLKPNILKNGDFRLKSTYIPSLNFYSFTVNSEGWNIVSPYYAISQGYEKIDDGNIAYYISSDDSILSNTEGGNAYFQTDSYTVKMGTNNQLKITVRCKVRRQSVIFGTTTYQIEVPYVKLRVRIKYGSQYLQNDGSWTSTESTIDYFITTFNEYQTFEFNANQPTSGTPVAGMSFDVRIYHAYAYYAQFQSVAALEAFETYDSGNQTIPTGYKTELRDDFSGAFSMYYYQLEETTAAASGYDIIRPDDYHSTNNPRQWVRYYTQNVAFLVAGTDVFAFYVDRAVVQLLQDGKDPIDTVISIENCEPQNTIVFEKDLYLGSDPSISVTETNFSIDLGVWFPNVQPGLTTQTLNILSAKLIYTGWLRDSSGASWINWTRDGYNELAKMHSIWLKSYSEQYKRSWRLLRARIESRTDSFGFLNIVKDVNDSERLYLPISLTINDKSNSFDGEFLEFGLSGVAGIDGNTESPSADAGFTTGFSLGFNA